MENVQFHPDIIKLIEFKRKLKEKSRKYWDLLVEKHNDNVCGNPKVTATLKENNIKILRRHNLQFHEISNDVNFAIAEEGMETDYIHEHASILEKDLIKYETLHKNVMEGRLILPFVQIALKKYGSKRVFINKKRTVGLDPYSIIIHYPVIQYTSSQVSTPFHNVFIGLSPHLEYSLDNDGKLIVIVNFTINYFRTGYTLIDAYTGMDHGHVPGRAPDGIFKRMCLGDAEVKFAKKFSVTKEVSKANVVYFFLTLNKFIKWESGIGGPYKRIHELRYNLRNNAGSYSSWQNKVIKSIKIRNLKWYLERAIISKHKDNYVIENKLEVLKRLIGANVHKYLSIFQKEHIVFTQDNSVNSLRTPSQIQVAEHNFDRIKSNINVHLGDKKTELISFHQDNPKVTGDLFVPKLIRTSEEENTNYIDTCDTKVRNSLLGYKDKLAPNIIEALDSTFNSLIQKFLVDSSTKIKTFPKDSIKQLSEDDKKSKYREYEEYFG